MRNLRFSAAHISILCIVLSLLYSTNVSGGQPDQKIDRLAKAYGAARTEFERRAVCLEAIDAGVIARGRSVTVIDQVFGTAYAKKQPLASGGLEWGTVDFHPLPPPPSDAMAAAHIGWFLAFQFDSAGAIQNYYLSNVHK